MNIRIIRQNQFYFFILLCIGASILLSSIYSYRIKQDLIHDFIGIKFILDSNANFDSSLLYTYDQKFDDSRALENISSVRDTLFFKFPRSDKIVKKFRLDFGNDTTISSVIIRELQLILKNRTVILNRDQVIDGLYNNSGSVSLDKENKIIHFNKEFSPYDPYIIFSPLAELVLHNSGYSLVMLFPFFIFLLLYIIYEWRQYELKLLDGLILLFIFCIPLKIAWTTFCTLLLCVYGLIYSISNRKVKIDNPALLFFTGMFCLYLIFGRPNGFSNFHLQLSYIIFMVLAITIPLPKYRIYKYYSFFVLALNGVMLASGVVFLLWLKIFYGQSLITYYENLKVYSGDIRFWLYYDHAAFLSYFGLVGMLFLHELFDKGGKSVKLFYLYHILLILFIVLSATRICFLIYLIFLLNLLTRNKYNWKYNRGILLNGILFLVLGVILSTNIKEIDESRYQLWTVSVRAIRERPLFGYGVGQSNRILHDKTFIGDANFSSAVDLNHSHNQFLTFLIEIGLIGLLTLLIGITYFLWRTKLYKNFYFVLFLFGLSYMFLTESILQTSKPLYVICFLFLVFTTNYEEMANDSEEKEG